MAQTVTIEVKLFEAQSLDGRALTYSVAAWLEDDHGSLSRASRSVGVEVRV